MTAMAMSQSIFSLGQMGGIMSFGNDAPVLDNNKPANVTASIAKPIPASSDVDIIIEEQVTTIPLTATPKKLNHNIQRIMKESWFRPVAIFTSLFLVIATVSAIGMLSKKDSTLDKRGDMEVISVDESKTGQENLNAQQADYLKKRQQEEAEKNAASGITNAPSLVVPSATVNNTSTQPVDTAAYSDVSAFKTSQAVARNPQSMSAQAGTGIPAALPPDINDATKYQKVGEGSAAYYIRRDTQEVIVPPNQTFTAKNNAPSAQPGNGTAMQNTTNSPNGGGTPSGNSGNGGNGGDGGGSAYTPDPTIERLRQDIQANAEAQRQEDAAFQQQQQQLEQQRLQQQQQLAQQRQQMAMAALNSQVQTLTNSNTSQGFTTRSYTPTVNANSSLNMSYNANQPQFSDYQRRSNGENVQFDNSVNISGAGNTNSNFNSASPGVAKNTSIQSLPSNIIRAGTTWPVVVTKEVNTDEGLQVIGQIMSGKFAGATVYGMVQPTGRDIGVVFERIAPRNKKLPIIPVNAIATTIGTQKQAVATDKSQHYLQNYSVLAAESVFEGFNSAYQGQQGTTIKYQDGTTVATTEEPNAKIVRGKVIGALSGKLNQDISGLGNRPPTFKIAAGSVVNMMLMNNLDVTQTAEDLGGGMSMGPGTMGQGNQGQGQSSPPRY